MRRCVIAIGLCSLLLAAGCGGTREVDELDPPTAGDARISIVSPKQGDEVKITKAEMKVEVTGFDLVDKMGQEALAGEGHIIYYVWNGFGEDGTTYDVPVTAGQPANAGGTGYVASASPTRSFEPPAVSPGRQLFAAQLVNNDFTPLEPPQVARVTVEVTGKRPVPGPRTSENRTPPPPGVYTPPPTGR